MKILMLSPHKVVAVAYKNRLFMTGSKYRTLTGKNLAFWIGGLLWEVVVYERWSQRPVQLYMMLHLKCM